jgi:hypothetical protein
MNKNTNTSFQTNATVIPALLLVGYKMTGLLLLEMAIPHQNENKYLTTIIFFKHT